MKMMSKSSVRRHRRYRYAWCGNTARLNVFRATEKRLEEYNVFCQGTYTTTRLVPDAFNASVDFIIAVGGGPVQHAASKAAKKSGKPIFITTSTSFHEIFDILQDRGFIDHSSKMPVSLYGFHDEERAKEVAPVTHPVVSTPVLTAAHVEELLSSGKERSETAMKQNEKKFLAVHRRGEDIFIRDTSHKGRNVKIMRPVTVDGDTVFRSASDAAKFLEVATTTVSSACGGEHTIRGMRVTYATIEEALGLQFAYRDTSFDKDETFRRGRKVGGQKDDDAGGSKIHRFTKEDAVRGGKASAEARRKKAKKKAKGGDASKVAKRKEQTEAAPTIKTGTFNKQIAKIASDDSKSAEVRLAVINALIEMQEDGDV